MRETQQRIEELQRFLRALPLWHRRCICRLVLGLKCMQQHHNRAEEQAEFEDHQQNQPQQEPFVPWGFYFGSILLGPEHLKDNDALTTGQELVQFLFDNAHKILLAIQNEDREHCSDPSLDISISPQQRDTQLVRKEETEKNLQIPPSGVFIKQNEEDEELETSGSRHNCGSMSYRGHGDNGQNHPFRTLSQRSRGKTGSVMLPSSRMHLSSRPHLSHHFAHSEPEYIGFTSPLPSPKNQQQTISPLSPRLLAPFKSLAKRASSCSPPVSPDLQTLHSRDLEKASPMGELAYSDINDNTNINKKTSESEESCVISGDFRVASSNMRLVVVPPLSLTTAVSDVRTRTWTHPQLPNPQFNTSTLSSSASPSASSSKWIPFSPRGRIRASTCSYLTLGKERLLNYSAVQISNTMYYLSGTQLAPQSASHSVVMEEPSSALSPSDVRCTSLRTLRMAKADPPTRKPPSPRPRLY